MFIHCTIQQRSDLVMGTNLPIFAWRYVMMLHAATLIRFRPTTCQAFSAYQMVTGYGPNVLFTNAYLVKVIYVPLL